MVCWVRRVGRRDNQAKVPVVLVGCVVEIVEVVAMVWLVGVGQECWDSWCATLFGRREMGGLERLRERL